MNTWTSSLKQYTLPLTFVVVALCTFAVASTAQANAFTATVDVAGGTVIAGESVTLNWYVTGGPATCSINHGVGSFDVTADSQGGSVSAVPPASGEPFVITCTRGTGTGTGTEVATDSLVVIPNPVITFTSREGTEVVNGITGEVWPRIDWNAQYATECSEITYKKASTPGLIESLSIWRYDYDENSVRDIYKTSGRFMPRLTETTTFYITCKNTALGTEKTKSITITVIDPPPPEPVVIDVIQPVANPVDINRDTGRNYSTTRFEFRARNATYCNDYRAYNLHEYPTTQTALPENWEAWSGALHRRTDLRLGTSTILTVTCGRPEVVVSGITYPATSTTLVKQFNVIGALEIETSTSTSPYAALSLTTNPTTAERNALSGVAYTTTNVSASNVDYCQLHAYRVSDGEDLRIPGWPSEGWRRYWADSNQDLAQTFFPVLTESMTLVVSCRNIYHHYFGDATERANANVYATTTVTVTAPPGIPQKPNVWLYSGPSVHMNESDIWDNAVSINNMEKRDDIWNHRPGEFTIQVIPSWTRINGVYELTSGYGTISFPFNHPHGAGQSDVYNVHMRYCDESDGAATYTLSTDGSGVVGTLTSDQSYPGQDNDCSHDTTAVSLLAEGVVLTDGDIITLKCIPSSVGEWDAEHCEFTDLYFGTGSGDRVVTVPVDPLAPQNQIIWMSENATFCADMEAETSEGAIYRWSYSNETYGSLLDSALGSITEYKISCERPVDDVFTNETVEVYISNDPDIPLDPVETVSDEATYDIGACWDVDPDPDVLLSSAPLNHVVAPENLHLIPGTFVLRSSQCVPLVDLSVAPVYRGTNLATDSVVDIGDGVDNVNGTYNLSIVPYVQNLAAIDLPANASIPYRVSLTGGSVNEISSGFFNQFLPANTPANTYELTNDRYDGIIFGTYDVEVRFNLDGTPNYPDSDFSNNRFTDIVNLAVPTPHMALRLPDGRPIIDNSLATVEMPLVRSGENTNLTWSVNVNYPLNCTLTGPTIGTQNLTLGTVGSNEFGLNPSTDTVTVSVQSTAEFQLQCTEPSTGQVFTETGLIEVVPDFQEL